VTDDPMTNVDEFRHRPVNGAPAGRASRRRGDQRLAKLPMSTSRPYAFCTARRVPTFLIQPARNTAKPHGLSAGCTLGAATGAFSTFARGLDKGEALYHGALWPRRTDADLAG
jgi:hypothetical protein